MKIRVLEVFAKTNRGGAESMIMSHYRLINKNAFQLDFVNHTQNRCDYDEEIKNLGGNLYHIPQFKLYNIFSYQKAWHNLFYTHPNYDVIHIHYFTLAGIILPVAKKHGIKVRITHSHTTRKTSLLKRFLFHFTRKIIINDSTLLLACSKEAGINIFKTNNFIVFKNAIDTKLFSFSIQNREKTRQTFNYSDKNIVIGNVGSFRDSIKNQSFIVKIFKGLYEKNNNYRLLLVGDGIMRNQIEKEVEAFGLSDFVIFTGVRNDIPNLLMAMDLFFFPSLYEGLGIVAVEAQASGCPVVMSTTVPNEVSLTDIVTRIRLSDEDEIWLTTIDKMAFIKQERTKYQKIIEKKGYDVRSNIKVLNNIYQDKIISYD